VIPPLAGTTSGRDVVGNGAGGDQTIYLDQLAEQIVVAHLERAYRSGFRFRLISEELGERDFGGDSLVLADPLDGSFNAKMGLPYYAVVLAATQGDRLQDVRLGYVQNLVTGDEFHAVAGGGAFRNGRPLHPDPPRFDGRTIPLVQVDAPTGVDPREGAAPILARAEKQRQLGGTNDAHCISGLKEGNDVAKIFRVIADNDGDSVLRRFDDVMTSPGHETATYEGDVRQPIE